ncbi:iron-regulated protein [Flavobacterium arcticum]|uniref:Iron-regulated protein n=1 Tax=Flavobacterium arcticum TaxID=1784713 RepID=A0A345HBR3_9FLAO|nr:ChaN family lipoprotein [Flavobacterium arcticum]AXG74023.1 iron-regulated protein [Flavobacterium arcticum]KAF2509001.1 ChaN family lipoprotein [Flavobacterium arcticum]
MKLYYTLTALVLCVFMNAQDKQPYQLYTKNGKKVTYKKLLKASAKADVVLFGEHHNDALIHWLQLELTKDLAEDNELVLGAEMIEADNQTQLNQYLKGEIDQKAFDTVARLWNNHKTDYKPLVDFAKEKQVSFIATNIPRRYASMVFKKGFPVLDTLPDNEKAWIAPLPIAYDATLPGYVKMLEMMGGHGGDNLPKAQAVKDATMAYFIAQNLKPNTVFIHYNGTYHSDNFEGINWYLKRNKPEVKIITIAAVSQKDISKLEEEYLQTADFILVVDEDMTKTY